MNKTRFFLFLLMLCATMLFARGNKEETSSPPARIVQVTGIVRLVGTGLFPELVITNSDGDRYVSGDEAHKLHEHQQRTVTIEAEETEIEMIFASGISAGTRRILRNVRIIAVQ